MRSRKKWGEFKLEQADIESYCALKESAGQIGRRRGGFSSLNGRYGVFNKLKSIFSVVCDFFNRGVDPFTAPLALEYGVPHHSVRKSRFSGVARAKREAKKRRNRRG